MSIESVMPSNHLILCHLLLLLPPIPPSIRVFSSESTLHMRWPKYWSFSFSIIPSKEHPGLISFRMDWLDLLAVQGILQPDGNSITNVLSGTVSTAVSSKCGACANTCARMPRVIHMLMHTCSRGHTHYRGVSLFRCC